MSDDGRFTSQEYLLLLTAFAAGSVDATSFFRLGGVFASAMTGNLALLAIAMGIQPIVEQLISVTTIVFTTTLAALIGTITDSIINGSLARLREVKIQSAVVVS